jgi:hypothetical protein
MGWVGLVGLNFNPQTQTLNRGVRTQVSAVLLSMEGRTGEFATYVAWMNQNNHWVKVHDAEGWWAYEELNSRHKSPIFAVEQQLDHWIAANPL